MRALTETVVKECKKRLITAKEEILNRVQSTRQELVSDEKGGDEADQTVRILAETEMMLQQERMRRQLLEIELALSRIAHGNYGICEETEEIIEVDRLLAIPWTRLSIEGAELRESLAKRYVR